MISYLLLNHGWACLPGCDAHLLLYLLLVLLLLLVVLLLLVCISCLLHVLQSELCQVDLSWVFAGETLDWGYRRSAYHHGTGRLCRWRWFLNNQIT